MRTPKTIYRDGIVIKFSVDNQVVNYNTFLWEQAGNSKRKISSGIFKDNVDEIIDNARYLVVENPKYFGYDHDYWMAHKEQLESQNMPTEMLN